MDFAEAQFGAAGVAISSEVIKFVYSITQLEEETHTPRDRKVDEFQLETHVRAHSAANRGLSEFFDRLGYQLRELYPQLHGRALTMAFVNVANSAALRPPYYGAHTYMYPLMSANTPDGMDYGIAEVDRQIEAGALAPEEGLRNVFPVYMHEFIRKTRSQFTATQLAEWLALERSFPKN